MKTRWLLPLIVACWVGVSTAWPMGFMRADCFEQVPRDHQLHHPHPQAKARQLVAMNSSPFSSIQPRPKLPVEPEEFDPRELDAYYDWRNDLFFREFDLTGAGSVNFMTARRTYKVWLDEFGTPVVLTVGDPVFYWIDLNGNGKFEEDKGEMWKDAYEDGVTGNEEPYNNLDIQEPPGPGPEWSPGPHGGFKQPPCDPRFGC